MDGIMTYEQALMFLGLVSAGTLIVAGAAVAIGGAFYLMCRMIRAACKH